MIQYSFSPNWYRGQCVRFDILNRIFYYSSNCIIYRYDMQQRQIVCELNLKNWLIKKQGYNLGGVISRGVNVEKQHKQHKVQSNNNKNDNNKSSQHITKSRQSFLQKQKILKISSIELIKQGDKQSELLIVGFNCIGVLIVVQYIEQNRQLRVRQIIDLSKQTNTEVSGVEYIYVNKNDEVYRQKKEQQLKELKEQNKMKEQLQQQKDIQQVVIFTIQGQKINIKININNIKTQLQNSININKLQVQSFSKLVPNISKRHKHIQIKSIIKDTNQTHILFLSNNLTTINNSLQQSNAIKLQSESKPIANPQLENKSINIIIYDSKLQNIIQTLSIQSLFTQSNKQPTNKQITNQQQQQQRQPYNIYEGKQIIMSVDYIQQQQFKGINKYLVLTKPYTTKLNIFSQTFYLYTFTSIHIISSLKDNISSFKSNISSSIDNNNNIQSQTDNKQQDINEIRKIKIQIIYPKKIHHKLTQQQKSSLTIKYINNNYGLLTGRLGEMIILNLKQIQLQSILNNKKNNNNNNNNNNKLITISIRPYSYQQEENILWRIQHSQRHYKGIYAIYRVKEQTKKEQQQINTSTTSKVNTKLYLIGTDHILTSWNTSTNINLNIDNPTLITYQSNLKFLTSSVDQIILSQLQPSLVFLRLRDSNIRSFQPYSERKYWLNQFWKHTNVSFCKQIQKTIMHPKQIGVTAMVNKQGKIILYDLYQERLIRLIQLKLINTNKDIEGNQINKEEKPNNQGTNNNNNQHQHNKNPSTSSNNKSSKNKSSKVVNKQKNSLNNLQKGIQINSISFQHISILSSLQSLYQINSTQQSSSLVNNSTKVQLKGQQFYQKRLDKNTVIMIQSNELILVLVQNPKQPRDMLITMYRKVFKLQRVYKTKYWDGNVLMGSRKRKGELVIGVSSKSNISHQQQVDIKYLSMQREISLPLGVSSRYIFKLSSYCSSDVGGNNVKDPQEGYMLSMINYKGNKLCVVVYSLSININSNNNKSSIVMNKQLVSEQFTIPNISSSHHHQSQSSISIQHLIVSQQVNQSLVAVYNNTTQTITLINYQQLINTAIDKVTHRQKDKIINKKSQSIHQNSQKLQQNSQILQQNSQKLQQSHNQHKQTVNSTYKRTINQLQGKQQIHNYDQQQQQQQQQQLINTSINITQFSQLKYKIQSILFNQVYSLKQNNDISHLIILGKDQSVRLLNINQFINTKTNTNIKINNQLKNYTKSTNPFKVNHKSCPLKAHFINKLEQNIKKE